MNPKLFLSGLLQLLLSSLIGVLVLYLTWRAIQRWLHRTHHISHDNLATALVSAGILFSVGYITAGAGAPLLATLRLLGVDHDPSGLALVGLRYTLLFIAVSVVVAGLVTLLALTVYTRLTRDTDEMAHLANNDVAVGLLMATVVVVVALFARDGLALVLESLVPYPRMAVPLIR